MRFAKRVRNLRFEGAYAVLDRAQRLEREGREIVHLEIGQPDFPTFPRVAMAGIRAITEGKIQPYLRAVGGVALLGGSFIEASGRVFLEGAVESRARVFLAERNRRETTLLTTLAAGVTLEAAPGYQLRFEARDIITRIPTVTGAGDYTQLQPYAQVGNRTVHLLAFTVALDLVLERQRTRRY
jgi:hypothetical protein